MLTADDLLKELKAGSYRPVYLLMGEEPYPIDLVANFIEDNALADAEKDFNQTIVYGRDTSGKQIGLECEQYPTFASRRVVIVKEAQETAKIAELEPYVSHCLKTTVLVLCHKYKTIDKRLKLVKAIEKAGGAIIETKKLYDNQVLPWITSYAAKQGIAIEDKAAAMLAEQIGTNLSNIVSAIEKLKVAMAGSQKTITADLVEKQIGASKEYNSFELRDAIFNRNASKAYKIAKAFGLNERQYPVQPVISMLFNSFQKLFIYQYVKGKGFDAAAQTIGERPFSIQRLYDPASKQYNGVKCMRILEILQRYDMRSKGFAWPQTPNKDLLVQLIAEIFEA